MRLLPLFLMTALVAFSSLASAQMAEPFTPPGGLHPHQPHCQQHEIVGDNALMQRSQDDNSFVNCTNHQA
ncbi:hypothetical protein PRCB_20715 [Pantoea rodasii]|uniref:Copper-binding protein n=1 Tax=Pantoea rodasii TaxID=1076549 RepID=A0A2M9W839_9GAMM|nr:hypothetical protein HA45_01325 [Pantoea rodasii]PJZ03674.1 hypothetical protein PRCB_20715 [Pantoea rodasii]